MIDIRRQQIEKAIRENNGLFLGIIEAHPEKQVVIFQYRGIDMAMYSQDIDYHNVNLHIVEKIKHFEFPKCKRCSKEMDFGGPKTCFNCIRGIR